MGRGVKAGRLEGFRLKLGREEEPRFPKKAGAAEIADVFHQLLVEVV